MEHYLRDDEDHFLIERLQNRKIRLELGRLKTQNLDVRKTMSKYLKTRFTFGNTTPPSNTQQYHYLFFNNYKI